MHVKLNEEYCDHEDPVDSLEDEDTFYHEAYTKHPVTVSAKQFGWHWTRILPFALFWDGVVYSKKDSFWALFARNLRTQEQFLLWIIRQRLRYIPACPMDMDGHGQSMRQKIALGAFFQMTLRGDPHAHSVEGGVPPPPFPLPPTHPHSVEGGVPQPLSTPREGSQAPDPEPPLVSQCCRAPLWNGAASPCLGRPRHGKGDLSSGGA